MSATAAPVSRLEPALLSDLEVPTSASSRLCISNMIANFIKFIVYK